MITLNPLLVRELRQAVRSKMIVVLFLLFLGIEGVTAVVWAISAASTSSASGGESGRGMFGTLFSLVVMASLWFVPVYTSVRFSLERSSEADDLYVMTALTPGSIIRGKVCAAAALTLLIFCSALPFMAISYRLRGVDVLSIIVTLVEGFALVMLVVQAALFTAASRTTRIRAMVGGIAWILAVLLFTPSLIGGFIVMMMGGVGGKILSSRFTLAGLGVVAAYLTIFGLFHALAISRVMPPMANRALAARGYITAVWAAWGIVAVLCDWIAGPTNSMRDAWSFISMIVLLCAIPMVTAEDEVVGTRVMVTLKRLRLFRLPASLLCNGSAAGIVWVVTLAAATVAVMYGAGVPDEKFIVVALFTYLLAATFTSMWFRRIMWPRTRNGMIFAGAAIILSLSSAVPVLAVVFMDGRGINPTGAWSAANLVDLVWEYTTGSQLTIHLSAGAIWCACAAVLNVPWFLRRMRQYFPAGHKV